MTTSNLKLLISLVAWRKTYFNSFKISYLYNYINRNNRTFMVMIYSIWNHVDIDMPY